MTIEDALVIYLAAGDYLQGQRKAHGVEEARRVILQRAAQLLATSPATQGFYEDILATAAPEPAPSRENALTRNDTLATTMPGPTTAKPAAVPGEIPMKPPAPIAGVGVSDSTTDTVTLVWAAPGSDSAVTGYVIAYHKRGSKHWNTRAWVVTGPECHFDVRGLAPSTFYEFHMASLNDGGIGGFSPPVITTTAAPTIQPDKTTWRERTDNHNARGATD